MKKLLSLMLAAVAALALTACGGGGGEENGAPPIYSTQNVADIAEAGAFSETLEELDGDTAFLLYKLGDYGLSREDMTDCAVLRSSGATCEEAAVLVFSDAEQAETAVGALEDYVAGQIIANADYRPAEIPKLESARIDRRGETVLLVVANDLEAVPTFGG